MNKIAFVFPGQGSQSVGMLNEFVAETVVRDVVEEGSAAIGQDIWKMIELGPVDLINQTVNTQPIMLVAAYAMYALWVSKGYREPDYLAGHSLGEYTALLAAGVFSLSDAIKAVRFRATVMQDSVPLGVGSMAAVLGLADPDVMDVCKEIQGQTGQVVEAVNFNAPMQVVIAGHTSAVEAACMLAKERGAKRALLLPVSAPFHSSLLRPASEKLAEYLAGVPMNPPKIPVVNNVDVAMVDDVDEIRQSLVRQASSPVRWVETIHFLRSVGVSRIVECGPGNVLSGLVKRIDGEMASSTLNSLESFVKVQEGL